MQCLTLSFAAPTFESYAGSHKLRVPWHYENIFSALPWPGTFGLGFETGFLLGATNKKVVLLCRRELEKKVSLLISGNTHPNCTLVPYTTVEDAEKFIAARLGQFHGAQSQL